MFISLFKSSPSTHRRGLEACPPEVCALFFALACTDDGFTGRSLSLVSKYIHHTSKPFKYQSVAIRGAWQAFGFASLIDRTPPHLRKVRHLCAFRVAFESERPLSLMDSLMRELSSMFCSHPSRTQRPSPVDAAARDARRAHMVAEARQKSPGNTFEMLVHQALVRILMSVAPTLETLSSFMQCDAHASTQFIPLDLPILTELTICYPGYTDVAARTHLLASLPTFPSLQRLNLASLQQRYHKQLPLLELFDNIPRFAPVLTHLCLPIVTKHVAEATASNLEDVAGINGGPELQAGDRFPPTLEKVFIQLDEDAPDEPTSPQWSEALPRIHALAQQEKRLVFIQRKDKKKYHPDRRHVYEDWLDRIEGGDGCWSTDLEHAFKFRR